MKGLRDSRFIARWRALYDASNPGRLKDKWSVDGVDWTIAKHGCFAPDLSYQLEIHTLARRNTGSGNWTLVVVIEHWWGPDRRTELRHEEWCRLLFGRAESVINWVKRQAIE